MSSYHASSIHNSSYSAVSSFRYNYTQKLIADPINQVMLRYVAGYLVAPLIIAVCEVLQYYVVYTVCSAYVAAYIMYMQRVVDLLINTTANAFSDGSFIVSLKIQAKNGPDAQSVHFTYGITIKTIALAVLLIVFGVCSRQVFDGMFARMVAVDNAGTIFLLLLLLSLFSTAYSRETERFLGSQLQMEVLNVKIVLHNALQLVIFLVIAIFKKAREQTATMWDYALCFICCSSVSECAILATSVFKFLHFEGIHVQLSLRMFVPLKRSLLLLILLKFSQNLLYMLPEALLFALSFYLQINQQTTSTNYALMYQISAALYALLARISRLPQQTVSDFLLNFCGMNMAQYKYRRIAALYKKQMIFAFAVQFVFSFVLYLLAGQLCKMLISGIDADLKTQLLSSGVIESIALASFYGVLTFPYETIMQLLRVVVVGRDIAFITATAMYLCTVLLVFGGTLLWGREKWIMHNLLSCSLASFLLAIFLYWYGIREMEALGDGVGIAAPEQESAASDNSPERPTLPGLYEMRTERSSNHFHFRSNLTSAKSENQGSMFFQAFDSAMFQAIKEKDYIVSSLNNSECNANTEQPKD